MSRLSADEILAIINALNSFIGSEIDIVEGITRERAGRGYDRHSATNSRFRFLADKVLGPTISGDLVWIESQGGANSYCWSCRNAVSFSWENDILVIVEHYEENTARRTTIRRAV